MYQSDSVLRMYAESGLRTLDQWITLGREIASGVKPRLDTLHRGIAISLYSRDQTQRLAPSKRRSSRRASV